MSVRGATARGGVDWYDTFCVAIVGASVAVSIYVVWTKERSPKTDAAHTHTHTHTDAPLLVPSGSESRVDDESWCLWSSCWRGMHPGYLLAFRVLSVLLLSFFLSWDILRWGASIFIYYTEWTFALVILYFAIGSVMSAYGCWLYYSKDVAALLNAQEDPDIEDNRHQHNYYYYYQEHTLRPPGFWGYLMQTTYQTCAGAVILTDVVFWAIIVPLLSNERLGLNLLMGCMHTVNIVLLLLDTSMNRLPFPWFRIAYFVLWSAAYVIFQWLIHLFGLSWWPYPFLELSSPWAPLWYFVLAVSHLACYGLYALIVKAKDSLFSRLFPDSYIKA